MDDDARIEGLLGGLDDSPDAKLDIELVAKRLFGEVSSPPKIDRFTVLEVVGSGGMGTVYAARDPSTDRKVAIKVCTPPAGSDPTEAGQARLVREARVASRLQHPNIVAVHEHGIHQGRVFVVMEFVDGLSLDAWLEAAPREWAEVLEVFLGAGEGLAAAHAAGIVHRDFKPANVLIDAAGRARVADFGLARPMDGWVRGPGVGDSHMRSFEYSITATGRVSGTPAYMAPELFTGAKPAPQADVYAFCVALLEASRGRARERGWEIPGDIVDALLRGIEPEPAARWQGMRELLDALAHRPSTRSVGALGYLRSLVWWRS